MNLEKILKHTLRKGASEAEVYIQDGTEIQVQFMGDDKEIKTVNSTGIGIRVSIGKRLGQYSTSILDEKNVRYAIDKAILIAKASPIDDDWNNFNREFGQHLVNKIKASDLSRYQEKRLDQGASPRTVDYEISIVKTMVTRAFYDDLIEGKIIKIYKPIKRKLKPGSNARKRILCFA